MIWIPMGTTALLLLALVLVGSTGGQSSTTASSAEASSADQKAAAFGEQRAEKKSELTKDNAEEEDALVLFETILHGEKEIPKDEGMIITSDDDDDNEGDDDDDGGNNDDEEDEIDEDISSDSSESRAPDVQIRHQGDLHLDVDKKESDISPRQRQDTYDPFAFAADPSPLLRLTQGGYQRPYSRRGSFDIQREGGQSETDERPSVGAQSDGNMPPRPPPRVPKVTYTSAYQPQTDNGAVPMFHHLLDSSDPSINTNGAMSNGAPNGFFNAQPSSYAFRGNGFLDVSREPNQFSQYQISMVNPNLLYQSPPQFVQAQSTGDALQRPVHNLFQTSSFPPYASVNNAAADSSRPDYYTYFRNPLPMSLPHFQGNPNLYNALSNGAAFNSPPDVPGSSSFLSYPGRITSPNTNQRDRKQQQNAETRDKETQDADQISVSPDKEDPVSVPFGTRIPQESPQFAGPEDVYIRYPMKEAGYATEESLPSQNANGLDAKVDEGPFPFLAVIRPYQGFSSPDPYRSGGGNGSTGPAEESVRRAPLPSFKRYPERDPFYAPVRSPIVLPERYPFSTPLQQVSDVTPACAKDANASLCFKDPEYPRRELLYALNSDSFLLERLVVSDQRLDVIPLVEGGAESVEVPNSPDNYVCKSDLQYGTPLRARNIQGAWKIVVNVERAIGGGKFIQPVRLEVCRGAAVGEPCSLVTDLRTRCVQKYSLQRLLSWSAEKGVHNDVYRLPVACSCQVVGGGN